MSGLKSIREDELCVLCRNKQANCDGSHLVPNFISHKAFTYDGKGKRDHEIAYLETNNFPEKDKSYYARDVSPEKYVSDIGHEMTDEEYDANVNILVRDGLFCRDCEKRFTIVEKPYSDYYNGVKKDVDSKTAYLFWLSVFWRMSAGYMSMILDWDEECEIRGILDRYLITGYEGEQPCPSWGDYGYVIWRLEKPLPQSGIFSYIYPHSPYVVLMGDMIVMLISRVSQCQFPITMDFLEDGVVNENDVNQWNKPFVEKTIGLKDFLLMVPYLKEKQIELGYGRLQEKGERLRRELLRADKPLPENFDADMEEAIKRDYLNNPINLEVVNKIVSSRKMIKRFGKDLDIDQILTPDAKERYTNCLKYANELGADVSRKPFAKELLGDDYLRNRKPKVRKKKKKKRRKK